MDAVSQFVRHGRNVTASAIVAAQHVRVVPRRERRAKSAAAFSAAHLGVNPTFAEKIRGERGKLFVKAAERGQNQGLSLRERKLFGLDCDRRVQVGVLEFVYCQQTSLE